MGVVGTQQDKAAWIREKIAGQLLGNAWGMSANVKSLFAWIC